RDHVLVGGRLQRRLVVRKALGVEGKEGTEGPRTRATGPSAPSMSAGPANRRAGGGAGGFEAPPVAPPRPASRPSGAPPGQPRSCGWQGPRWRFLSLSSFFHFFLDGWSCGAAQSRLIPC